MSFNPHTLQAKFPALTVLEIDAYLKAFRTLDSEGSNSIELKDLPSISQQCGEKCSQQDLQDQLQRMDLNSENKIDFIEYLTLMSRMRAPSDTLGNKATSASNLASKKIVSVQGASQDITHSFNEDEKEQFSVHINQTLANDPVVKSMLPINSSSMELFTKCQDGLLLAKLINSSVPETIDERVLNRQPNNPFKKTENNNLVLNSAKAIGCRVVNIGAQDLLEGRPHLILGLIWQIIRAGLIAKIDIKVHPELFRLLDAGETLSDFLQLPQDRILQRWVNYHLKKAGWHRRVDNFSGDIKDSENYTVLLNQLAPNECSKEALNETDLFERAELVIKNAEKVNCAKYVNAKSIVSGNPRLNFAFVANLFNTIPGLEPLTEKELAKLDESLFVSEGDREARVFALWLNSLGVDQFVNNLFQDLRDGVVLLQALDKVKPGIVNWKSVTMKTPITSRFKRVENTNYVLVLGKSLKFSLVGIQGADITDGVKNLTLGFVWQLMREHVVSTLQSLSKAGKPVADEDMIQWANQTAARSKIGPGPAISINKFGDQQIRTGVFFLRIIDSLSKGTVDSNLVSGGQTEDEAKLNAKYAISIARKLGATIFLLPEDIIESKPKMILTFIGSLMALEISGKLNH